MTTGQNSQHTILDNVGGEAFSTTFLGYPLHRKEPGGVPKHMLYRWHILDRIRFESGLKVTIQALGWYPDGKFHPLTGDCFCSILASD